MNCPKCDEEMEHIDNEPDVDIQGGWECSECDIFIRDCEVDTGEDYDEDPDRQIPRDGSDSV